MHITARNDLLKGLHAKVALHVGADKDGMLAVRVRDLLEAAEVDVAANSGCAQQYDRAPAFQ